MWTHWKLFLLTFTLGVGTSLGFRSIASEPTPGPERAAPKRAPEAAPQASGLLIDLGNETCPVMGGAVDGKTYGEWNHLRVGYCCPGCDGRFLENPETALDDAGVEWREVARSIAGYQAAGAEHKPHLLAALRKRWNVVREPAR